LNGEWVLNVYGQIAGEMSLDGLGERLRGEGWRVEVGAYVVRLRNERQTLVFAPLPEGGFILEDVMADECLLDDAQFVSRHLTDCGLRHRLEVYDRDRMLAYFHHDWPSA
jgi:hypothetical protein